MTTTKPDAPALPLGIRRLPDAEHVACKACGTPCGPASPRETFTVTARADPRGMRDIDGKATFGVCPACAALDASAARTLDAHPGIRRMIGSASIARHRVLTAFYALAVLGVEPSETYTADGLLSLIDRLSVLGVVAAWHRQFAPIWHDGVSGDSAAAEPWLHVGLDIRADIRREYGAHLADRMPPRPIACPTGGCAWCGIGAVTAKRTAAPWTPTTLHGARGHLCPTCARYRDDGEPMGAALLDTADPDRAIRRRSPLAPDVRDLRGWAQTPGTRPNAEPWGHVDLDGLRALLVSADW